MYRCASCGKENPATYDFCLGCGAAAPAREPEPTQHRSAGQLVCRACGSMNWPQTTFCVSCAQRLVVDSVPVAPAATFRDFAPRLAYALYIAHQQLTTRRDHTAHVAILAGGILAVARAIQGRVAPSLAVLGEAGSLAIRDGAFAQDDPLVVSHSQIADLCRHYGGPTYPRDDAGLAAASVDPDLAGRAQALADALRTR